MLHQRSGKEGRTGSRSDESGVDRSSRSIEAFSIGQDVQFRQEQKGQLFLSDRNRVDRSTLFLSDRLCEKVQETLCGNCLFGLDLLMKVTLSPISGLACFDLFLGSI